MTYRLTRNIRIGLTDGVYTSGLYEDSSEIVKAIKEDKQYKKEKGLLIKVPDLTKKSAKPSKEKSNAPVTKASAAKASTVA